MHEGSIYILGWKIIVKGKYGSSFAENLEKRTNNRGISITLPV